MFYEIYNLFAILAMDAVRYALHSCHFHIHSQQVNFNNYTIYDLHHSLMQRFSLPGLLYNGTIGLIIQHIVLYIKCLLWW